MSELYSHLHEDLQTRLAEAERVGYEFVHSFFQRRTPPLDRMDRKCTKLGQ